MLNIPESVKTLYKQDGVNKNFRAHFPNGELADITNENIVQESVKFQESVCSQDVFKFGLTEASVIEFETVGVANMYGMTIECYNEIDCSSLTAAEIAEIEAGTWDGELIGNDAPNLLDGLAWVSGYYNDSGNPVNSGSVVREEDYVPVVAGAVYDYVSTKPSGNTNAVRVHEYNSGKGWLRQIVKSSAADATWTASEDAAYIRVSRPTAATDVSITQQGAAHPFFRVPYGVFRVESCPRDHQAMAHRRVTAYTERHDQLSPIEQGKQDARIPRPGPKYNTYRPNVLLLAYQELYWNSARFMNTMPKTPASAYSIWIDSPAEVSTALSTEIGGVQYAMNVTLNYSAKYYPFAAENGEDWFPTDALFGLSMEPYPSGGSFIDEVKDGFTDARTKEFLTLFEGQVNDFLLQNSPVGIMTMYPTGGTLIKLLTPSSFYHFTEPPKAFYPLFVGAGDEAFSHLWLPSSVDVTLSTYIQGEADYTDDVLTVDLMNSDPVLYHYDMSPADIYITVEPTSTERVGRTTFLGFSDAYDPKELVNGCLELQAQFASASRLGGFALLRLSNSSPVVIVPGDYSQMWFDEYNVEPIGTIRYSYTDEAGEEQVVDYQFGDGASIYDMTDNAVLKAMDGASQETIEALLDTSFIPYLAAVNFTPIDLAAKGLPYIEAGDALSVTAQDGTVCNSYALRQEIDGIQSLTAQIDSESGLIIDSEEGD